MSFLSRAVGYVLLGILIVVSFIWDLFVWPTPSYTLDFDHQTTEMRVEKKKKKKSAESSSSSSSSSSSESDAKEIKETEKETETKEDVKESKQIMREDDQKSEETEEEVELIHHQSLAGQKVLATPPGGEKTLYEVFQRGYKKANNGAKRCLAYRVPDAPYQWYSYAQVLEKIQNFGSGLISLGLKPGQSTRIGIYARNCVHWVITEQAVNSYSWSLVPLYDTLGKDATKFIVTQTELQCVVFEESKVDNLCQVLSALGKSNPVKVAASIGLPNEEQRKAFAELGVQLLHVNEIEALGKKDPQKFLPPKPSDIATICYTSGTTGDPKGVVLTHANFVGMLAGMISVVRHFATPIIECIMSYLPLAHVIERALEMYFIYEGGAVGFFSGDAKKLIEDVQVLHPSFMPVVPRVLERIYDKILDKVNSMGTIKRMLFDYALKFKQAEVEKRIVRRSSLWDFLVFRKMHNLMGGKLIGMLCGGAPLSPTILKFLRAALGCFIIEAYGQTECGGGAACQLAGDPSVGNVGPPTGAFEFKLIDVKEMGYSAAEGKGEVCFRGPAVTTGYFKQPKLTREVLDSEGWLHTGDIGVWQPNGCLKLIDRRKAMFKLSQGEYISPEKVESVYARHPCIQQIMVHGIGTESQLVGFVVVNPDPLVKLAQENGIKGDVSALVNDPAVVEKILKDLQELGKQAGLATFEQVFALKLLTEVWTVDNGLMTPTLKVKRPAAKKFFAADTETLYKQLRAKSAKSPKDSQRNSKKTS
eukprot:TRINITY_DN1658_c0_g3_i1.p1 TRINITY_DN1658_c0_g3~~TRINITY_DN1658_c0_g3_i1.p1  ORF type:complete len:759 (+),score=202.46 TRINITY_DN1658_c0_g3_i1:167-2443(+)